MLSLAHDGRHGAGAAGREAGAMTIPVALAELYAAIAERGARAYLLTVSAEALPHAVHVAVAWQGEALSVAVGRRTAANAAARPAVTLLFPVRSEDDYSLIVDGTASVAADSGAQRLLIRPNKAVLHRPAAPASPTDCGSDCVPLVPPRGRRPG
jgi:hypothetical protein